MTDDYKSSSPLSKAVLIAIGSFGQAVFCIFLGNATVMLLLFALPPLLVLEGNPHGHFLLSAFAFAFVSLWAGHLFPRFAFLRSGIAFCFMVAIDLCLITYGSMGVMLREESGLSDFPGIVAVIGVGVLFCAFAGAIGARLKRDFYSWVREEIEEFSQSISYHASTIKPQAPVLPLLPCRLVESHLSLYVIGKRKILPSEIRLMVEEHLTVCEHCQAQLKYLAEERRSTRRFRKTRALHEGQGQT